MNDQRPSPEGEPVSLQGRVERLIESVEALDREDPTFATSSLAARNAVEAAKKLKEVFPFNARSIYRR